MSPERPEWPGPGGEQFEDPTASSTNRGTIRIAWVSYDFGQYCIPQATALARHHPVFLALAKQAGKSFSSEPSSAVDFLLFEKPRLRQPIRQVWTIGKILRRLRAFRPDVVHLQSGHLWFNLALPVLQSCPLVVTIHDPRHHAGDRESKKTPQAVMDFGYRRADRVIVHGQSLVSIVHEGLGVPLDRIHSIPHVAVGEPASTYPDVEEIESEILFFGRIWGYKGLEYLIRAEPLISREIPGVHITIAGTGEDFDRYRNMMRNPDRFTVLDRWIDDEDRAALFQRAAIVVLPYTSATQSGVVPLAYSFSKPVIATRVGAIPDSVDDGKTGILIPPRDAESLAQAVVSLLRDPARRFRMGEAGRRKLENECSPDEIARQSIEVYRLAIRDRRSIAPAPRGGGR